MITSSWSRNWSVMNPSSRYKDTSPGAEMARRVALAVLAMAAVLPALHAFTVPGHYAAAWHGALDLRMQRIGSNQGSAGFRGAEVTGNRQGSAAGGRLG